MNLADANYVLAAAAAYDNRSPSNEQAMAWSYALGQHKITRDEAVRAIIQHFANSTEYLLPAHVVWNVRLERRRGLDHSARLEQEMLRRVDADDPGAVIHTIHRARELAAKDGTTVPARPALPSRYETDEARLERRERGAPAARAIAAAALKNAAVIRRGHASDDDPNSAVLAARERARLERHGTEPTSDTEQEHR